MTTSRPLDSICAYAWILINAEIFYSFPNKHPTSQIRSWLGLHKHEASESLGWRTFNVQVTIISDVQSGSYMQADVATRPKWANILISGGAKSESAHRNCLLQASISRAVSKIMNISSPCRSLTGTTNWATNLNMLVLGTELIHLQEACCIIARLSIIRCQICLAREGNVFPLLWRFLP